MEQVKSEVFVCRFQASRAAFLNAVYSQAPFPTSISNTFRIFSSRNLVPPAFYHPYHRVVLCYVLRHEDRKPLVISHPSYFFYSNSFFFLELPPVCLLLENVGVFGRRVSRLHSFLISALHASLSQSFGRAA